MTEDFFRSRLEAMIDLSHPLAVLASRLPWDRLEAPVVALVAHKPRPLKTTSVLELFGTELQAAGGHVSAAGRPRLSTRLMLALTLLKNSFDLSDEELVARFAENVYWQHFAGFIYFDPRPPCDPTQIGRFRTTLGEAGLEELLNVENDNPGLEIIHRGKIKTLTKAQRRWLKRRQAVEPAIGHLKSDNRMQRCWLHGATGDALHALCCAVGYNLRWLMRAVVRLGLKGLLLRLCGASGGLSRIEFCRADYLSACAMSPPISTFELELCRPFLTLQEWISNKASVL